MICTVFIFFTYSLVSIIVGLVGSAVVIAEDTSSVAHS